jgi:hypothetical protein
MSTAQPVAESPPTLPENKALLLMAFSFVKVYFGR